jgi:hypothetical protein
VSFIFFSLAFLFVLILLLLAPCRRLLLPGAGAGEKEAVGGAKEAAAMARGG